MNGHTIEGERGTGDPVLVQRDETIGTITLNRPDRLNAFDLEMGAEFTSALNELGSDADVRVVVITGAGRGFCAGANVAYLRDIVMRRDRETAKAIIELGRTIVTMIRETPKPVIASVNGPAAGGGANLALACDFRIASDRASIGQVFNRIGLHPDWGGTYFLPRLVGPAKALELIFSAEMVAADEAARIGLFSRVVPHDQLAGETRALAAELAAKPPLPLALVKRAVYAGERRSLQQMLDLELENQLTCFNSTDAAEGMAAFLEKRVPTFVGH